mmetsp:Transcript_6008/g.10675  ORF Transcript_6008/g.10675 Transcript_6008/m.10675 type:complete len:706 (-) Transcript_6008:18-2135(-)|eukprot:CAMPEP_0182445624 /NCGR_PEP_ID=MMETSP1172-20130603/3692_1 /TAXON_ID=708627 /ORGANISM="Timspurckia oligopyrenoides, Strain CCMP3278" /LENGTH=705 /DNA_ID=CAMNT_0024641431 /DNA_START=20 /DNA_END=2137 /DNA_ORIENTATION=-
MDAPDFLSSAVSTVDDDVIQVLKKGVEVRKAGSLTSKMRAKIGMEKPRLMKLSDDNSGIEWTSHKSRSGKKEISLISIHRVRLIENERLMKIDAGDEKREVEFLTTQDFDTFARGFQKLVRSVQKETSKDASKQHIRALWVRADQDASGTISYKEFEEFMCNILKIDVKSSQTLRELMAAADVSHDGQLSFDEFAAFINTITVNTNYLKTLFSEYAGLDEFMNQEDLRDFLMNEQGYANASEAMKEAGRICANHGGEVDSATTGLRYGQFIMYLLSVDNLAYQNVGLEPDANHPLSHYYMNSSHNTYLEGNQLTGEASKSAYESAILSGARCVELDVWDGDKGEPLITHGHTLTGDVMLSDVLEVVKKFAFADSDFPFVLSIENHCSTKQEARMAELLSSVLGDCIVKKPATTPKELPKLASLKKKVLVKCKVKENTCPQLIDLIYFVGAKFQSWSQSLALPVTHMHSFSESKLEDILSAADDSSKNLIVYNQHHFARVYPKGTRVNSANYDPCDAWDYGCQLVALNFQTMNQAMLSNFALFSRNHGCGYVLKPNHLRGHAGAPQELTVQVEVIMCFNLPKFAAEGKTGKSSNISPYVLVECGGASASTKRSESSFRTTTVKDNDFDPVFSSKRGSSVFKFDIRNSDIGSIHFWIMNDGRGKDSVVAVGAVSTALLQPGFRYVTLRDYRGRKLQDYRGLLCHFSL